MIFAPLHTGYMGLMGALDSVAVSVGSSPPSFTSEPDSNTGLSRGQSVSMTWDASAGTGNLAKYELFKNGAEIEEKTTVQTRFVALFVDFKLKNEGDYVVRVTQANGAYKDSGKVILRMAHKANDGSSLPVVDGVDVSGEHTAGGHWIKVDSWSYYYDYYLAQKFKEDINQISQATYNEAKRQADAQFRDMYPDVASSDVGPNSGKELWVFRFSINTMFPALGYSGTVADVVPGAPPGG